MISVQSLLPVLALCSSVICYGQDGALGTDLDPPELEQNSSQLRLRSVSAFWENDGAFAKSYRNSDRHYTNGMKLDFAFAGPLVERLAEYVPSDFDQPRLAGGLAFSQLMFTPDDITSQDIQVDDRPYAGWLYAGLYLQRADQRTMDHLELDLGVVGAWSGAEEAQKFIHSVFPDNVRPNGWEHQLTNELTVNAFYERRWRTPRVEICGIQVEAIGLASTAMGNIHINAYGGAILRAGFTLPDDFGPARLTTIRDSVSEISPEFSLYTYARGGTRFVGRNMLLDGNTFANSHSVDRVPFVHDVELGLVGAYGRIELSYSITWLTDEFQGQDHGDSTGTLALTYRHSF